jgi:O-antigen/teichoic acid export membrane protein
VKVLEKQRVGREAVYFYTQSLVSSVSGYFFWIILTQLTTSNVIGTLSAITSVSEILANIAVIGMPYSVQRFVGKSYLEKQIGNARVYLTAAFIFVSVGLLGIIAFVLFDTTVVELTRDDYNLKAVTILIVISSTLRLLFVSIAISSLKARILLIVNLLSSASKVVLSIFLVLIGVGAVGLSLSYLFFGYLLTSIVLGIYATRLFRSASEFESRLTINLGVACRNLLTGAIARWVPMLVTTLGYQLGTIVLFGIKGTQDTAVYFISLTIASAILLGTTSLTTIALPVLSSISDGRKRFAWQTIRWGCLISLPLASSLIFYSQDILKLFGQHYVEGELSLQILLLSTLPVVVANGLSTLVYSYGNYKRSLAIDLGMNIPRVILYFAVIPIYGPVGAAMSFTAGSILAFVISVIIAHRIKMLILWKDLVVMFIVPLLIGYICHSLNVAYLFAIPVGIILSYVTFLRFRTMSGSDILDVISILPTEVSEKILNLLKLRR